MRLSEVKLTNFRSYAHETAVEIDPFTVLVGRNDAGKSSVLDALEIFFNNAPIENDDCCKKSSDTNIRISCVFEDLPGSIVLDDSYATRFADEYLLRDDGKLEIVKEFNCSGAKGKLTGVYARAVHPTFESVNDLLELTLSQLKSRAKASGADLSDVNQTVKAQLRKALREHVADLRLANVEVPLTKAGGKEAWEQIETLLPVYALFKSDRASTDQDAEAQDPLKAAVREAIRGREQELDNVVNDVRQELTRVAEQTVEKIREMSPDLANQLTPTVTTKKWESLFSISLTGDDDIPINKRGSGTRRLVLLNFFRAKAEDNSLTNDTGIIYAVEEPETSQHPDHQMLLLNAFEELVAQDRCQVIITTHTPTLARRVDRNYLRLISPQTTGPVVEHGGEETTLIRIKDTLGVLPDHDIKVFFGVEGKHDINFLKRISRILAAGEDDIPDLETAEADGTLVFMSLGGSNMDQWLSTIEGLDRPEFYLSDRDEQPPARPRYDHHLTEWRNRGCTAWATSKRELENYIEPSILQAMAPGYAGNGADFEDVPLLFAKAVHSADTAAPDWDTLPPQKQKEKASRAKKRLNMDAVDKMTPQLLNRIDTKDEIRTWLRDIGTALKA